VLLLVDLAYMCMLGAAHRVCMQSEVCYIMKWHKPKVELHACVGPFYPAVSPALPEQLPVLLSNHVLQYMSRSDVPEVRRVHGPPLGKFVCVPPDPPQDDGAVALWALHQETQQVSERRQHVMPLCQVLYQSILHNLWEECPHPLKSMSATGSDSS
jgi:hypothetical protein